MKLWFLLSFVGLAVSQAAVLQKPAEAYDEGRIEGIVPEPQTADVAVDNKKVDKRSYGWSPWIWPSYGLSYGHSYGHGYGHGHGLGHGYGFGHGYGHSIGHVSHISIGLPIYSHGLSYGWPLSYGHGYHSKW